MLGENQDNSPEFEASPQAEAAGVDLESARQAYQIALNNLRREFPDLDKKSRQTTEMQIPSMAGELIRLPFSILWSLLSMPLLIVRELAEILGEMFADARALFGDKNARLQEAQKTERASHLQRLLLETLWARDFVQYVLQQPEPVPYHIKRDALQFLIANDDLLDTLRRRVIDEADINPIQLRKSQPTPPPDESWWWYMDNRRIRRARRMNAFWFAAAIIPAMAGIILITLLTQRLAIDGPDVLSGASALAQLVLGAGSVLAGRELLNMFLFDRSSGRSWQGEATFALAVVFLVVVASFYVFAPPAAASVYNWFGQQALASNNAAEAELYLESATRLNPNPHAAHLLEVGCLYQKFGSREQAQKVFERVLEADSRLLLARYHLAEIYSSEGDYQKARQLANDGINLLSNARNEFETNENSDFLPGINSLYTADKIDYLLRLSLGHAQLGAGESQSARQALAEAYNILFNKLLSNDIGSVQIRPGTVDLPCNFDSLMLNAYIFTTRIDLYYYQAQTYDAICKSSEDNKAAVDAWGLVRNTTPYNTLQDTYVTQAVERLQVEQAAIQEGKLGCEKLKETA